MMREARAIAANSLARGHITRWISNTNFILKSRVLPPKQSSVLRALLAKYKRLSKSPKYKPAKPMSRSRRAELSRLSRLRKELGRKLIML
jgi:hypothetical protein